jgi:hypothetical protein
MTIELITGTPGAGKTTYAVAERIAKEAKRKIKLDDETCIHLCLDLGTEVQRRIVCAGVRGLVIEHERLPHILTRDRVLPSEIAKWNEMVSEVIDGKRADTDEPVNQRLPSDPPKDVPGLVQNWWLWCKPGDLIVVDEVQFVAPRGTLGKRPTYWIEALAIHRHYGVDFLFITQDVQGIDTFIRGKVGMHRHVRSVMGSSLCLVYSWDHCSNTERTSLASKESWLRRAKHYKLFHSSVAHVSPPSTGRAGLIFAALLIGGFLLGMNGFFKRFQPAEAKQALAPADASGLLLGQAASVPAVQPPQAPAPRIAGCMDSASGGYCIDSQGQRVDMPKSVVAWNARNLGGFVKYSTPDGAGAGFLPDQPAAAVASAPDAPSMAMGFSDPSPRPNPVRPLSGGLFVSGVPAAPSPSTDGQALADMRGLRK